MDRQERALQRQRGAGSRQIAGIDFGLHFGMGNDRQERQQMRQRGAGNRKVDHVDFGLSFPSSARSRRSSSRTPQARQPSKTPTVSKRRGSSVTRSLRQTPINAAKKSLPDTNPTVSSGDRSSKRRKLSSDVDQTPMLSRAPVTSTSVRTTRSSARKESSVFTIAEDDEPEDHQTLIPRITDTVASAANASPTAANDHDPEKENAFDGRNEVDLNAAPDPATLIPKTKIVQDLNLESSPPEVRDEDLVIEHDTVPLIQPNPESEAEAEMQPSVLLIPDPEPTLSKGSRPQKRKRRSVVGGRMIKRRSKESSSPVGTDASITQPRELRDPPEDLNQSSVGDEKDQESEIDQNPGRPQLRKIASRREFTTQEDEEDGDETYIQEASPEPPTPGPGKKVPRNQTQRRAPDVAEGRRRSRAATFPVLTHHGKLSIDSVAGYDARRPLETLLRNRSRISVWFPDESEELLRLAHRCRILNRSNG